MATASKPLTSITLPSDCELTMIRTFDAPRAMVFDAWTQPELLRRWFGPPGWSLEVCEADLTVGGGWRQVLRKIGGTAEIALFGVYREIASPDRLVHTQNMEGCEGQRDAAAVCTMVLSENGGRTTMTHTTRYPSREVRDSVLQHGTSEQGMDVVFDKLAALLSTLAT